MTSTDWVKWHEAYGREGSGLGDRLAAVQAQIVRRLDDTAPMPLRVVSACAGDGRDLLGVLAGRADADRVSAFLVECDTELATRAESAALALPARIVVHEGNAAKSDVYAGSVPADLVLLCGIFGNISDSDIQRVIRAAPQLCAKGAEVVWTRHRGGESDVTLQIRSWFADAGFEEVAFIAPDSADTWSVGVHRLVGPVADLELGQEWFRFFR